MMKTRLEWFVVPCVASMFAGNAVILNAQDAPKGKRDLNVVVVKNIDDLDAKSIRDKVAKELENSGISDAIKEKILKDIEMALDAATTTTIKETINAKKLAEVAQAKAKEAAEKAAVVIEKAIPKISNRFTTQLFRDPKGESFRIGVQCVQMDDEESENASKEKAGLEVKAVFDDSPAKKAGIQEGDVLLTVDATKISEISDLTDALQAAGKKDGEVSMELKRDDKTLTIKVKPTKMKSADLELENIKLSLPTEGFVIDDQTLKALQTQMKNLNPAITAKDGAQAWSFKQNSEDLKKDLEELKSELADMKKMIREMAKTMGEKK